MGHNKILFAAIFFKIDGQVVLIVAATQGRK